MLAKLNYKGAIAVTYAVMMFEGALNTVLVSAMVMLARYYNVEATQISVLVSLKGLGTILSLYVSGRFSDRYGRRNVIFAGLVFFAMFIAGMLFTRNFRLAMIFSFLGGIGHGLMDAPAMSILFDVFGNKAGPAMSVVQVFFSGGGVLTSVVASFLISADLPWQYLFYGYAVAAVLLGILILLSQYPVLGKQDASQKPRIQYEKKPHLMKEGLALGLCCIFLAAINAINFTWLPTFGSAVKGLSEGVAVRLLSVYQIGAVMGSLGFAYVLRKVHATKLMMMNPFIGGLMLLGSVTTKSTGLMFAFTWCMGIMMGVYFSLCINMGGELFYEHSGTATGAIGTITMGFQTIIVTLTGKLIPLIGVNVVFRSGVIILFLLSLSAAVFQRLYESCKPVLGGTCDE